MTHRPRPPRRAPLAWAALIIVIAFVLAGLTLVPLGRIGDGSAGTLVGTRAPALDALDLNGRRWTLDDAKGRLVWVNYWATWCPPCRIEMPLMERLHERYGERLLIVGVNFGEDRDTVADFVRRYELTYPILLDPTLESYYRWSPQFGLPQHYFVDAEGRVLRQFNGELAPEAMVETVKELLAEVGGVEHQRDGTGVAAGRLATCLHRFAPTVRRTDPRRHSGGGGRRPGVAISPGRSGKRPRRVQG